MIVTQVSVITILMVITSLSNDHQSFFVFFANAFAPFPHYHHCGRPSFKSPRNKDCKSSLLFASSPLSSKTKLWYTNNNDHNENNPSILNTNNNFNNTFSIHSGGHSRDCDSNNHEGASSKPQNLLKNIQMADHYTSPHTYAHPHLEIVEEMPWSTSISPTYTNHNQKLPFMPYYTYTKDKMFSKLHNVQPYNDNIGSNNVPETNTSASKRYYYNQKQDDARIINECYQSEEYRKIRLTYYDGGNKIQVFNSLWYPNYNLGNIPLLGIDLICFNGAKCLVVVDFQPLTCLVDVSAGAQRDDKNDKKWEEHLARLWNDLPTPLKGHMSKRFYDEHQFFSKYMIFGRFDIKKKSAKSGDNEEVHESIIYQGGELWEAFVKYVTYHIDYVQEQYIKQKRNDNDWKASFSADSTKDKIYFDLEDLIKEGQRQYDEYSAERDPAKPMFCKVFGQNWGTGYVHEFLFDLSSNPNQEELSSNDRVTESL